LWSWFLPAVSAAAPATQVPRAGSWRARQEAFGRVAARAESRIRLPFAVRVTAVDVAPGGAVTSGQPLLRFVAPSLRRLLAAYADARHAAALADRRATVVRANEREHTATRRDLLAVTQQEAAAEAAANVARDRLEAVVAVLGADLERADLDQRLTRQTPAALARRLGVLRAPFAGVVVNRAPPVGAWVEANTLLVELEDLRRVFVSVGVPEADLARWRGGETSIAAGGRRVVLAPLAGIAGVDRGSGLRLLRYAADNPRGNALLRDGEWVRVAHRAAPRPVLWVPQAAVVSRRGQSWCLVVKDGVPEPAAVEAGPARRGRVPVISGLEPGQAVVVEGAYEWLYRDLKDLVRFVD